MSNSGGLNIGYTIAECLARNSKADYNVGSQSDHTPTLKSRLGSDNPRYVRLAAMIQSHPGKHGQSNQDTRVTRNLEPKTGELPKMGD